MSNEIKKNNQIERECLDYMSVVLGCLLSETSGGKVLFHECCHKYAGAKPFYRLDSSIIVIERHAELKRIFKTPGTTNMKLCGLATAFTPHKFTGGHFSGKAFRLNLLGVKLGPNICRAWLSLSAPILEIIIGSYIFTRLSNEKSSEQKGPKRTACNMLQGAAMYSMLTATIASGSNIASCSKQCTDFKEGAKYLAKATKITPGFSLPLMFGTCFAITAGTLYQSLKSSAIVEDVLQNFRVV